MQPPLSWPHGRAGPQVMPELPPQQLSQEVPSSPSPIVTASAASKAPFFRRNATNLSSRVLPRTEMPHYVPHVGTSVTKGLPSLPCCEAGPTPPAPTQNRGPWGSAFAGRAQGAVTTFSGAGASLFSCQPANLPNVS